MLFERARERDKRQQQRIFGGWVLNYLEDIGMAFLMAICCLRYRTNDCSSEGNNATEEIIRCRLITFSMDLIELFFCVCFSRWVLRHFFLFKNIINKFKTSKMNFKEQKKIHLMRIHIKNLMTIIRNMIYK